MAVQISDPRSDLEGLDDLAQLWTELHRHHREVSEYPYLVRDAAMSWARRLQWYRDLLAQGAAYVTATDDQGRLIGYAMVAFQDGPDDTFEVTGGVAELVTLVVTKAQRSAGVGRALLTATEDIARARGFDTVKIAVMSGNARAKRFYEAHGYALGELVLYRRVDAKS
jgi:ribosomal protein S18 acetylase RimI-like enzyme